MKQFASVDEYINSFPHDQQKRLKDLRKLVKEVAPQAQEKISYGIPYYSLRGSLVYFGAFKDHVSLFPASSSAIESFKKELAGHEISKGTIRFPLNKPLPVPLIRKIILYRVKENLVKETGLGGKHAKT